MIHKIIVSDRDFNVKQDLTGLASNIRWDINRLGGCAAFSFDVPIRFCEATVLGANYNIKIYSKSLSTGQYTLRYQGRIEDRIENVRGGEEVITVQGFGYQSELSDIYIDADYSSKTIEFIVDAILDLVTPNTNITKGTISATGFTADTLELNTNALSAIQSCANIVGTREWGVDQNRNFTFQARSTTTGFIIPLGKDVSSYNIDNSSKEIVNRVIVTGGDVGGSPFTRVANDANSQLKFKRRDKAIQNSAVVTNSVADQLADAIFAEFADVVRRAKLEIIGDTFYEESIPIPLIEVKTPLITYGTKKYGEFLYSNAQPYQINRISYRLDDDGTLRAILQLGQLRPSISESISQLEFKIDQLRQQGV